MLRNQSCVSKCKIAIAHPEDKQIRKAIASIIPELNKIGIQHYWVNANGTVTLEK